MSGNPQQQIALFDEETPALPAKTSPVAADDSREYWKPGMVTSLPLFAQVDGEQTYTQCLAGIVEAIDGGTANVRIYSHPAYTGTHSASSHHLQLATEVPLSELGRYALNDHLQAVAAAGKLATGDLELVEAREKAIRDAADERNRKRLEEEAAHRAAQQAQLERGEIIRSGTWDEHFDWTVGNDVPAKAGDGRIFLLHTDKGAVQINISFIKPGDHVPWGTEAFGASISESGYRSLLGEWHPTEDDFAHPREAAAHIAATLQARLRPEAKPKRARAVKEIAV